MPLKEKVVHRQQFQNAQQTVEVVIKSKPKPKVGLKTKSKSKPVPFVRDCILRKELEKLAMEDEEKEGNSDRPKLKNSDRLSSKARTDQPTTNVQIHKKSRKRKDKKHEVLPPNITWREYLESCSSINVSESQSAYTDESSISLDNDSNKENPTSEKKSLHEIKKKQENRPLNSQVNHPRINVPSANLCKQSQADKVDRSIQTTLQATVENVFQTHPNLSKSVPRNTHVSGNQAKTSGDQTHSPFGESALRLLHHLRERLRSKGDSEGSEIVNAIEACFGTAGSKSGNKDGLGVEYSSSPLFPAVFPTPHLTTRTKEYVNEELKRVIVEQKKKLKEQEETIQELRSLSARLLAYHEQLTHQIIQETKNAQNDNPKTEELSKGQKKCEDSGIELSSSEDLQRAVKRLTSERDALLKEVKNQREIILNLEIKFSQSLKELESEKKSNTALSSHPINQRSNQVVGDLSDPRKPDTGSGRGVSSGANPALNLHRHTPVDSEADSAYEEKSSKSSRAASKNSSSYNEGQSSSGNHLQPSLRPREDTNKTDGTPRRVLSELGPYFNSKANTKLNKDHVQPASHPNYSPLTGGMEGFVSPHERVVGGGEPLLMPPANFSLSMFSDVSAEDRLLNPLMELQHENESNLNKSPLSETPVLAPTERYFESTHVNERMKSSSLSPSKTMTERFRFDPQLSSLQSTSGERTDIVPEPCSDTDVDQEFQ